jgi:hypothetical protein
MDTQELFMQPALIPYIYLQDSLNETDISTLALGSDENGKFSGTYKCIMGQTKSVDLREQMKTSNEVNTLRN